jgi:hypothetical protein
MRWTVTKVSDVGTAHPAVARLMLQTSDLLGATSYTKEQRDELATLYYKELYPVLIECWKAKDALEADILKSVESSGQDKKDSRVFHLHAVDQLEQRAEHFLYQAKNYLRNTLRVWNWFYGSDFDEASAYILNGSETKSKLETWAEGKFGADDARTKLIRSEQEWAVPLIRMRNALEHPGRKSGTVYIENIKAVGDQLVWPTWRRNDEPPAHMIATMDNMLHGMLEMGEDILVVNIRPTLSPMFDIYAIPENERDPKQPARLRVGATPEFSKMMIEKLKEAPPKA